MAKSNLLGLFSLISLVSPAIGADYNLVVMHTNDVHARYMQYNMDYIQCNEQESLNGECFGGVARRVTQVKEIRENHPNTLLLDGGDQYQGTLWFYYYKGKAASHFMETVGYDTMTIGNHEFDLGVEGLVPFLQNITFPVVSSNIDTSEESEIQGLFKKSVVLQRGGRSIGIVGYTYAKTYEVSKTGDLIFLPEISSIQAEVDKMTADGINIIIALGHSGITKDLEIAQKVRGVDIVVGGHTDTFLYTGEAPSREVPYGPYPMVVNPDHSEADNVLVVQDFTFGKYLGYLEVTFDDAGKLTKWNGNPILLDSSVTEDAETLVDVNAWNVLLVNLFFHVIGNSYVLLDGTKEACRLHECNLGNLVTDAMLFEQIRYQGANGWSEVSIALMNGGGIRSSINHGDITVGDVFNALPFGNTNDIFDIEGRYIRESLEHSVAEYEQWSGTFMQVAGLIVTYNLDRDPGSRVVEVLVKCTECTVPDYAELEDDRMYRVVCNGFLSQGSDGFTMLSENKQNFVSGNLDSATLQLYIEKFSPIIAGIEERIRFVTDVNLGGKGSVSRASLLLLVVLAMTSAFFGGY